MNEISMNETIPIDKNTKKKVFSTFIDVYFELLNFMKSKFEKHRDFNIFYQKNLLLKKTNIKLFIKTWHNSITSLYFNHIMNGDIHFFLNNVNTIVEAEYLKKYFNYFKEVYVTLDKTLIEYVIILVQKLTKLSFLYYKKE